ACSAGPTALAPVVSPPPSTGSAASSRPWDQPPPLLLPCHHSVRRSGVRAFRRPGPAKSRANPTRSILNARMPECLNAWLVSSSCDELFGLLDLAVLPLVVGDGRLDGVLSQDRAVDLHWREAQLVHDV